MIQFFNSPSLVTSNCDSNISYDETLDNTGGSQRILLEFDVLVVAITHDNRVGLKEEFSRLRKGIMFGLKRRSSCSFTYLLLAKYQVAQLSLPLARWFSQFRVERTGTVTVGCALSDLQVYQKLSHRVFAFLQDLLAINLFGKIQYDDVGTRSRSITRMYAFSRVDPSSDRMSSTFAIPLLTKKLVIPRRACM